MARQRIDRPAPENLNPDRMMLRHSERDQDFIEEANRLLRRVRANPVTSDMFENLLTRIRMHCEDLRLIATGYFQPRGEATLVPPVRKFRMRIKKKVAQVDEIYEQVHLAAHALPHTTHYVLEILISSEALKISHAFVNLLPVVGTYISCGATILKSVQEHEYIEKVSLQLRKFSQHDEIVRNAIYGYAIARVLLAATPLLGDSAHPNHRNNIMALQALLFSQLLDSLTRFEKADTATKLGEMWSQHAINQFISHDLIKPTELDERSPDYAKLGELKTQMSNFFTQDQNLPTLDWFSGIFYSNYYPKTVVRYSNENMECELWKVIYSEFLSPYKHRIDVPDMWNQTTRVYYTADDLKNLKNYYCTIDQALDLLQREATKLRFSQAYGELITFGNEWLLHGICQMREKMPWQDIEAMWLKINELEVNTEILTDPEEAAEPEPAPAEEADVDEEEDVEDVEEEAESTPTEDAEEEEPIVQTPLRQRLTAAMPGRAPQTLFHHANRPELAPPRQRHHNANRPDRTEGLDGEFKSCCW